MDQGLLLGPIHSVEVMEVTESMSVCTTLHCWNMDPAMVRYWVIPEIINQVHTWTFLKRTPWHNWGKWTSPNQKKSILKNIKDHLSFFLSPPNPQKLLTSTEEQHKIVEKCLQAKSITVLSWNPNKEKNVKELSRFFRQWMVMAKSYGKKKLSE